jgi:methionine-S-sulfoxide reductase
LTFSTVPTSHLLPDDRVFYSTFENLLILTYVVSHIETGNDIGSQYRSAIFYHNDEQKSIAEKMTKVAQEHYGSAKICTTVEPAGTVYPAEDYHQDYLTNNPHGYECATHFERTWAQIEKLFKK